MSRDILLPDPFDVHEWLRTLSNGPAVIENQTHFWGNDPTVLTSLSTAHSLIVGTGLDIYTSTLLPAIEAAEHEVILVTCFWARSATLSLLNASLIHLSQKALARRHGSRIRVRLCFSSMSLLQKLLHTTSTQGHIYHPTEWRTKLGLPGPMELAGLDLEVKSLFFRPFSVMHPKFVITDRRLALMPSCNVSWEVWLECCVSVSGPIVDTLMKFWHETWAARDQIDRLPNCTASPSDANPFQQSHAAISHPIQQPPLASVCPLTPVPLPTILLPSPHHNSLSLSIPFSLLSPGPLPTQTPLNTLLLHTLAYAKQSIILTTPNFTSVPIAAALVDALDRGVDVHLVTNRRMMVLEQLVTAGTITEIAVWKLVQQYKHLLHEHRRRSSGGDMEAGRGHCAPGALRIEYFCPSVRPLASSSSRPGKVHIKCTIFDGKLAVLGSGNMDRASWYTSQELGIVLWGEDVVRFIMGGVQGALKGRVEEYYIAT